MDEIPTDETKPAIPPFRRASTVKLRSFICLNNDGYDGLRRPRHILMQRLSHMGFDILFVSSAVRYLSQRMSRPHLKLGGIKRIGRGFYWYQPPALLPEFSRPLLGKISLAIRIILLHAVVALFSRRQRVFFVTVPNAEYIDVINRYKNSIVIYNIHDRYLLDTGEWIDGHDDVLRRADIILCGSDTLLDETKKICDKPMFLFPPAVDFDLFPKDVLFSPGHRNGKTVVGCVGNLGDQIDWPLLCAVATQATEFDFRLVGPVVQAVRSHPSFQMLERMPNVTFVGEVPHDRIPSIIAAFDLCIMPYVLNDYTQGVNPLKLFEYFALGKPVVSTAIPSVEAFRDTIYVATGTDGWLDSLRRAVAENDQDKFEAKRRLARAQDYDSRISLLLGLLGQTPGTEGSPDRSGRSDQIRCPAPQALELKRRRQ